MKIYKNLSQRVYKTIHWCLCIALIVQIHSVNAQTVSSIGFEVLPPSIIARQPILLKGVKVSASNPFEFKFIIDQADSNLTSQELKDESDTLIKYFLAAMATPENDLWVNLSPYESDRIVSDVFGDTEMGRDMLTQDYLLKQLVSSFIYPESDIGKKFWKRVYDKSFERYGTTEIPIETFHKVWVVPDTVEIYEQDNAAFVVNSRMKVMLEEDYVAQNNKSSERPGSAQTWAEPGLEQGLLSTQIMREIIIPEIEREVNEGGYFEKLRQIYHSLVLAVWYKKKLKQSLIAQIYADQNKVAGIDHGDEQAIEGVYNNYVTMFKEGVYDLIREEYDGHMQEMIPRKYFSGGFSFEKVDAAMKVRTDTSWLQAIRSAAGMMLLTVSLLSLTSELDARPQKFNQEIDTGAPRLELNILNDVKQRLGVYQQQMLEQGFAQINSVDDLISPLMEAVNAQRVTHRDYRQVSEMFREFQDQDNIPPIFKIRDELAGIGSEEAVLTDMLTGIFMLGEYDSSKDTVLFVHGANNDRGPFDIWKKFIQDEGIKQKYNVAIMSYDFTQHADNIADQFVLMMKKLKPEYIVDHSFGSVVIRNMDYRYPNEEVFSEMKGLYEITPTLRGSKRAEGASKGMASVFVNAFGSVFKNISFAQDPFGDFQEQFNNLDFQRDFQNSMGRVVQLFVKEDVHVYDPDSEEMGNVVSSEYFVLDGPTHGGVTNEISTVEGFKDMAEGGVVLVVDRADSIEMRNDFAMKSNPVGGIDFNPQALKMFIEGQDSVDCVIKPDAPQCIQLDFSTDQIEDMRNNIKGLQPIIVDMVPINNLEMFLGNNLDNSFNKENLPS